MVKIRHYFKDLCSTKGIFEQSISAVQSRVMQSSTSTLHAISPALQKFLEWYKHIFLIKDLASDPDPEILVRHIRWAQDAKRHYVQFLKDAFSTTAQTIPRWVYTIFKLGRYGVAAKALIQFASEFPSLCNPLIVETVIAPTKTRFTIQDDKIPLTCVLRRVVGGREEEYLSRLARIWNTDDPEAYFQRACSLNLTVHAEMQLVSFYDYNQQHKPTFRFLGVSKKSCYLCRMFLATHPESFDVSSCHQKLYISWMVPLAADSSIYKRYKAITTELSKMMEATARQDLESRLGSLRSHIPADSTAGVSLSGLTESSATAVITKASTGPQHTVAADQNTATGPGDAMDREIANLESSTQPASSSNALIAMPLERRLETSDETSVFAMVFHLMRSNDTSRQDIICLGDVVDTSTNQPSWANLVEILKVDNDLGLAFKEDCECLLVNNGIRVGNERQFRACLQYLRNSHVLNSEVLLCSRTAVYSVIS
ncbi:MAG: hypothetical protein Q9201_000858 [Fulgogasparrea decipioides]